MSQGDRARRPNSRIAELFKGWTPPKTFDEYRILRPLGRGGMGEVYLAEDTLLDRLVAVKFIGDVEPDAAAREQFLVEARAAARIQHPNVLTVYRVGELADRPFILSEFIRGKSLDRIDKRLPFHQALELGIGLARGLAAAHRSGVLHRDIKPANAIIADDGTVKLVDFGLAKLVDVSSFAADPPRSARAAAPSSRSVSSRGGEPDEARREPMPMSAQRPSRSSSERLEEGEAAAAAVEDLDDLGDFAIATETIADTTIADTTIAGSTIESTTIAGSTITSSTIAGSTIADATTTAALSETPPDTTRRPSSAVRGTPHYMAPELWRGEPATRRSDVYSLGALLFELCAGSPPYEGTPLSELPRVIEARAPRPIRDVASALDPRFAAIIDRCLQRDPDERFDSGDELREALEELTLSPHPPPRDSIPEGNPYRGLLPFEAEHRALFFGRSTEIGTLLDRLRSEPFVLLAGDSGVGKSSLCKAGILPLVVDGALGGARSLTALSLVPGKRPLASIAAAFAGLLGENEERLAARIRDKPSALARALSKRAGDEGGVLIFVDQLEELVTISDPEESAIVGLALAHLCARVPGVRLLMTARSDLLARLAALPGIGDELSRALYFLRPLSREKIREAIVGPARAKGVDFESDALVDALIDATMREGGSLPLLQFALAELWEARAGAKAPITTDALAAIGGVAGALARHADHLLMRLPMRKRIAARKILISLVTVEGTRARRGEAELIAGDPVARGALEALVEGRLLVARDAEGGPAYEVAHEALLKGWSTLRRWLDEQADSRAVLQRLDIAAAEWERLGRAREALWSARQLAEAKGVVAAGLPRRDAEFIEASRRAVFRNRVGRGALFAGVPLLIGLLYGALQIMNAADLDHRVDTYVTSAAEAIDEARAQEAAATSARAEAFAAFDAGKRDDGEAAWTRARALADSSDRIYARASRALEAALTMDAGRADVRDRLGDTLFERALASEQDRRSAERDDLLERLALYDPRGERRRRFDAPAQVAIESAPAGARVAIERFDEDERRGLSISKWIDAGSTPVAAIELAQGSYVITFSAEGRAEVRYPILLGRGERARVAVDLPPASAVPDGFVYIPPGRFLFGSSVDENLRRQFFMTVPTHEVTTDGYLIARNETTFGEWLAYLRDLPKEERARRTPTIGKADLPSSLELVELPSGVFEFTLRLTTQTLRAREGEKVVYRSRSRRAAQDWLRFPVVGVSREDAATYARWLDATGRVPGARLCTEREWERAARGADARELPTGDRLDPDDANFDETYGKDTASLGPDEVGSHPASQSPFGVNDMAGNVFEWVTSSMVPEESLIRSGSYYHDQWTARSTNRAFFDPEARDPRLGARICATLKSPIKAR